MTRTYCALYANLGSLVSGTQPFWKATATRLAVTGTGAPALVAAADAGSAFSLSITPTRLLLPAGQLDQPHEVKVSNQGRAPLEVEVGTRDFIQRSDGSLSFQEHAPYPASDWVFARRRYGARAAAGAARGVHA